MICIAVIRVATHCKLSSEGRIVPIDACSYWDERYGKEFPEPFDWYVVSLSLALFQLPLKFFVCICAIGCVIIAIFKILFDN